MHSIQLFLPLQDDRTPAAVLPEFRDLHHWGVLAYLGCWALGLGLWWFCVRRTDYQNRRQDYRALAEALRVQFYWRVAGLPDAAEDHYLRKQRSELEWIRYALRTWNALGTDGPEADATGVPAGIGFVARFWVRGQHDYFSQKGTAGSKTGICGERGAGDVLFGLNLAGARPSYSSCS